MIKKLLLTAVAAVSMVGTANAASFVVTPGSAAAFAPTAGTVTTFPALGTGFSLTGLVNAGVVTGSSIGFYAQPAFSDGSAYLAVQAGGSATLANTTTGYNSVSLYVGSLDGYNTIQLLDLAGNVIASFTGSQLTAPDPADGGQAPTDTDTNRRLTFVRTGADALIYGVKFLSTQSALEVDNVVFAVPEPATWMMMLGGFAFVGGAMRSRRRKQLSNVLA